MDPYQEASKKRRKGATRLSCAECRRLKLRCDRNVPCGSCVKRGCGAICPDGSLTTGQGNRFVLASTAELHEKISDLSVRVRTLEDALKDSHALVSHERHPLLTDNLLQIKAPLQRDPPHLRNIPKNEIKQEDPSGEVVDAFGSLSINAFGGANYYGSIANSWLFLQNEVPEHEDDDGDHLDALKNMLSPAILARSGALPLVPSTHRTTDIDGDQLREIYWHLPDLSKAQYLIRIYYRLGAWMYNPISQEDFEEDVYPVFYGRGASPTADDPVVAHKLSVTFMIFAIGSLMNSEAPAYNLDSTKYYHLARAALFQSSLVNNPTVSAVQALFLMTFYLFLSNRHGSNSGNRWVIMGTAIKIAQSIGLHRDPSKWLTDSREILRRRTLFWELYTYDSWQCFTLGRPPSFNLAHIDCKLPSLNEEDDSFHTWKHRFTSECMSIVHDQAFGAKTPSYATVLQLDRKLRAFPVPPNLQVPGFGSPASTAESRQDGVPLMLQRHIVLAIREMNLLYLHRSFFARALTDHPKDPLGSSYGSSVIAAYRSAGSLIALVQSLNTQLKKPSERIWFLWTHMFSCAIVLGSVVTRCPSMSIAPSALQQLGSACELFSRAAQGFRAQPVLSIMTTLQKKAHHSLEEYRSGNTMLLAKQPVGQSDDELAKLGGTTRLVERQSPPLLPAALSDRSPTSLHPVVPFPFSNNHVHPTVLEYLRTFPQSNSADGHNGSVSNGQAYGVSSPLQEHFPSQYRSRPSPPYGGEYDECQTPMELVQGPYPAYFQVYDYSHPAGPSGSNVNGYESNRNGGGMIGHVQGMQGSTSRGDSPEGNIMQDAWQQFVGSSVG